MTDALCESLREAFTAWYEDHGIVWFETDRRLAEAIAAVLGIEIQWERDDA